MSRDSKVIVIVQSRLGSTRLPEKGLLPLGSKPVIAHVLNTMHQVPAAAWYLATDDASYPRLKDVAESCGFEPFAGSAEDVLGRFCAVVEKFRQDHGYLPEIIVRATGDNPFLFGTAACASVDQYYTDAEAAGSLPAYFTLTGLPHGSGIEILHVESLLKARECTDDPYDHEHVGPALYRHQDMFTCIFKPAPACWNHPELRTTIDTAGDYQKAKRLYACLSQKLESEGPFEDQSIVAAFDEPHIAGPILLIPSVTEEHGTGHFRRCAQLAKELQADLYTGSQPLPKEFQNVLDEYQLSPWQLLTQLPDVQFLHYEPGKLYRQVVLDQFVSSRKLAEHAALLGPVISIDEGAEETSWAQYLLDVIPSADEVRQVNDSYPQCIPLPQQRKTVKPAEIRSALVCIGGQDPAGLTESATRICTSCGLKVTSVTRDNPIPGLREHLYRYDLVVTHYGFTAFEALAAGCAVILVGTTPLHEQLASRYGFACLTAAALRNEPAAVKKLAAWIQTPEKLCNDAFVARYLSKEQPLSHVIRTLSDGVNRSCPVCGKNHEWTADPVVFRGTDRTFRRCSLCGITYLSWSQNRESEYAVDYFFEDYKKQYGKTYLEDFDAIKAQGIERAAIIKKLSPAVKPRILDIGCAFGPFLSAAAEQGCDPEGLDINKEAVEYVTGTLGFAAVAQPFPFTQWGHFAEGSYDAVTMWYVIEHMADLEKSLELCNRLLVTGGVFAFSTPDLSGVTGTCFPEKFYTQSPIDHLSLWNSRNCATVLERFGFTVVQVVSTGHHPERFPGAQHVRKGSLKYRYLMWKSKKRNLGDTCQIYCVKNRGIEK